MVFKLLGEPIILVFDSLCFCLCGFPANCFNRSFIFSSFIVIIEDLPPILLIFVFGYADSISFSGL